MLRWGLALAAALSLADVPAMAAPVTVKIGNAPAIKKAIAAQRGHVVVVNFWATWCGPCVAEFPDLVKFSRQYKAKGVVVMAVSEDNKKDLDGKVVPFLTKQHIDFPAFLEYSPDPEDFIDAFDPKWDGDCPHTLIYNKQGRLVKTFGEGQTVKSFAMAIKPLL